MSTGLGAEGRLEANAGREEGTNAEEMGRDGRKRTPRPQRPCEEWRRPKRKGKKEIILLASTRLGPGIAHPLLPWWLVTIHSHFSDEKAQQRHGREEQSAGDEATGRMTRGKRKETSRKRSKAGSRLGGNISL